MSIQVTFGLILMIVAYKISDWRNWRSYYSTMLFLALGDLMYRFLFEEKLLWVHHSVYLTEKQIELVWVFFIYPSTILLFFTFYLKQKSVMNKLYYILFWILGYSIWEFILCKLGRIVYYNGWNYYCSVGFYFFMFPILILHHFKPLLAILTAAIFAIINMYIFFGTINIL